MIRKVMMLGIVMAFLAATTFVFAEDVFVTQNGAKYHKEICRLVKNKDNITKFEKKEALEDDYTPCKRCYKEDVKVEEEQK